MAFFDAASKEKFYFLCTVPGADFTVLQFFGSESISGLTLFNITLLSDDKDIDIDAMVATPAVLLIHRNGEYHPYTGLISEARYCSNNHHKSIYQITLSSILFILTRTTRSRIFQTQRIPDIVTAILTEHGIENHELVLSLEYPVREYVVQFNESDFDFVNRLMEEAGIWYFTKNNPLLAEEIGTAEFNQTVIITDDPTCFDTLPADPAVPFRPQSGLIEQDPSNENDHIFALDFTKQIIPQKVTVKSYNYRTPEIDLLDSRDVPQGHTGLVYEYGGNFKNTEETAQAAEIAAKRVAMRATTLAGKSFHRGLHAGYRIEVVNHPRADACGSFLLTSVRHFGKSKQFDDAPDKAAYTNEFSAIPGEAANAYAPEKKTKVAKIPGVINAKVDALGTDYATVDELGRYRIKLPFDLAATETCKGSKPVRMGQTYAGTEYGMHFPLHKEAEVLLMHVTDNPDKPLGIASVPDANTVSPVTSANKECSVLRSAGKNEITLNDLDGNEQMSFSATCALSLVADGSQSIGVGNNRSTSARKNEIKEIKGNQELSVTIHCTETAVGENKATIAGNSDVTVTQNCEETYRSTLEQTTNGNKNETFKADNTIEVTTPNTEKYSANYTVETKGDIIQTAKGPLTLNTAGDLNIKADGAFNAQGMALLITGTASVKLEVGGNTIELTPGSIEISSSATATMIGSSINTIGGIILLSGTPVNIN